jgi:large subunit ribosomal protein L18
MNDRQKSRIMRHARIRKKVSGTAQRPRMALMRSNKTTYVQFIDDENATTLAATSTRKVGAGNNIEGAAKLGVAAAEQALGNGITKVVVDRGGFKYHGIVKAVVESAVESGLSISSKEAK